MGYYRPQGDLFGDIGGFFSDVASGVGSVISTVAPVAALIPGVGPLVAGAAELVGQGLHALGSATRRGPQPSAPIAQTAAPLYEPTTQMSGPARVLYARRPRRARAGGGRTRRIGRSRRAVLGNTVPPTSPPLVQPTVTHDNPGIMAPRLFDAAGGTMTMPGTEVHISSVDPSPLQTFDNIIQSPPEFGGGGGGREQVF